MEDIKAAQLCLDDNGNIIEEPIEERLTATPVDYSKLSKEDIIRICNEKDKAIDAYEQERKNIQGQHTKDLNDMNDYYLNKIKELKSLVGYYERKFNLIKSIIDIEKEDKDDTIQRTTKR